jgi:hypothetical protein
MHLLSLYITFVLLATSSLAQSFQFSAGKVTQCDNINLSWTGIYSVYFFRSRRLFAIRLQVDPLRSSFL